MLRDGMPVDMSDGGGYTALHLASMCNQTDVIKHLLQEGADMNRKTRCNKETPLQLATQYHNTEAAKILKGNLLLQVRQSAT